MSETTRVSDLSNLELSILVAKYAGWRQDGEPKEGTIPFRSPHDSTWAVRYFDDSTNPWETAIGKWIIPDYADDVPSMMYLLIEDSNKSSFEWGIGKHLPDPSPSFEPPSYYVVQINPFNPYLMTSRAWGTYARHSSLARAMAEAYCNFKKQTAPLCSHCGRLLVSVPDDGLPKGWGAFHCNACNSTEPFPIAGASS